MKINHRLWFAGNVLSGFVAVVLLLLGFAGVAHAYSLTWTNGNDVWTSTTAWTTNLASGTDPVGLTNVTCVAGAVNNITATCVGGTGGYPSLGDMAFFTNSTSYTVTINTPANATDLNFISNSTGVVTLDASPSSMLTITGRVFIGNGGATSTVYWAGGTLNCQSPTPGQAQMRIGANTTNTFGALYVTNGVVVFDAGAPFDSNLRGLVVGSSVSVGKLVISGSGVVTNTSAGGTLSVAGGIAGGGQLIITNGGKLFVSGTSRIGDGAKCLALISGSSSLWSNASQGVYCGLSGGQSTLIISNGATLWSENAGTIGGGSAYSTCIVVNAGSRLITGGVGSENLIVGTSSVGSTNNCLLVYDGGYVHCGGTLVYGASSPSVGNTVLMGGAGAMSTGFSVVVINNTGASNNLMVVTNAVFTCSEMTIQGLSQTLDVRSGGTIILSNQYAVGTNTITTVMGIRTANGNVIIDGGTIDAASGSNTMSVTIGGAATLSGNTMTIFNGGKLLSEQSVIGVSSLNTGLVTGAGSVWSNWTSGAGYTNIITVGSGASGSNNYLAVSDGASLYNNGTFSIGSTTNAMYNTVLFGGPGAPAVIVNPGPLNVGAGSGTSQNSLTVSNATVNIDTLNVSVSGAWSNSLVVKGGTLAFNFMRVRDTNTVTFSAGTFSAGAATVDSLANNGQGFVVGDGTSAAYYDMVAGGTGYHYFNSGLVVTNNATLSGTGTILGEITVLGTLSPGFGASVGTITTSNDVVLGSSAILQYALGSSSDETIVNGNLTLAGTLNITDSGGFGTGIYPLFTYTGNLTNNTLTVGTTPNPALQYSIDTTSEVGVVNLDVSSAPSSPFVQWQLQYFGSTNCAKCGANADYDGTGISNTNKFLAGFNPTNGAAYLHVINIARTNNNTDVRVTYLGASGDSTSPLDILSRTNVLEFTTGTANGSYTNNFASTGQTNILMGGTGLGVVTNMVDSGGATNKPSRFYRVRVLLP
jgi:hypothetical protein